MLSKKLKSQLALNVSYLDTLQDICGEWHDMMLAIDLIKRNDQRKDSEMHLVKELEGLLHAVKTLGEYFDRNISVKKIMVVGS